MKILTAEQMREVDRLTTERFGVPSLTLMENAGRHVADTLVARFPSAKRVTVLCGKGNNGGDGFVAARHLRERGLELRVALLAAPGELDGDARAKYDAYLNVGGEVTPLPTTADWESQRDQFLECDVLLDALLGTGLSGPAREPIATVISDVNAGNGSFRLLAVDIPSGLASDSGDRLGESVRADVTVTFTAPKLGQVIPPNCMQVGHLCVAPIGSPPELYEEDTELKLSLTTPRRFRDFNFARDAESHKGSYGHVLIVAGSRGKSGAAVLAGHAALRAGAGMVTVATPEPVLGLVATPVPEMMTEPLASTDSGAVSMRALDYGQFKKLQEGKSVIAAGPGLTTHPETVEFVHTLVEQCEIPLVLDADALNALVGHLELLRRRRTETVVLTPHPGEMARLLGTSTEGVQAQRIEAARGLATEYDVYVVLKGFRTLVAEPSGDVWVNPTGGPGLAKGGSGDVLTGVLAATLAQFPQQPVGEVVGLGVYLHGSAGDHATEVQGEQSVMSYDVIECLPAAWRGLREKIASDKPGSPYFIA